MIKGRTSKNAKETYYPYYSSDGRRFWLTVPNDC